MKEVPTRKKEKTCSWSCILHTWKDHFLDAWPARWFPRRNNNAIIPTNPPLPVDSSERLRGQLVDQEPDGGGEEPLAGVVRKHQGICCACIKIETKEKHSRFDIPNLFNENCTRFPRPLAQPDEERPEEGSLVLVRVEIGGTLVCEEENRPYIFQKCGILATWKRDPGPKINSYRAVVGWLTSVLP